MRLLNTLGRHPSEIAPGAGPVRLYSCGPTVYRYVHIGNLRSFLLSDLIRRALEFEGRTVTQVMNITDVGHMTDEASDAGRDRMDLAVADEGLSALEIAAKYTEAFLEDAAAIGLRRATEYPRATDHIPEMLDMTERLLASGNAYEVGGNVYFDVASFPAYGALSGNTLDNLRAGHRQELEIDPNKRNPADFALWKRAGANRLMKWSSPWGEGFPGWHIECSAMSLRYLGDRIDLHTGGVDLVFPHHEDEIAQSDATLGHRVVDVWAHGGHLRLRAQKMAKSTGNVIRIGDLVAAGHDPLAYRYLTFRTRYRSEMDFTDEAMADADAQVRRIRRRMAAWGAAAPVLGPDASALDGRFRAAIADDLDLPQAVVLVHEVLAADVPEGERFALLSSWDRVLGLDVTREVGRTYEAPPEVAALVAERDAARARKDYATSDALRDRLEGLGLEVADTAAGTSVRPRA
ncbi:MAG: cysteine--tRNA ligase [Actinomycetota bacterium]